MKTIELSEEEFLFLGSILGHCLCGDHPLIMPIYRSMLALHNEEGFYPPVIDLTRGRPDCLYIKAPTVGKVISYNIKSGRDDNLCRAEILKVIEKYEGELIDG